MGQEDVSAAKIFKGSLKSCSGTSNAKAAFVSQLVGSRNGMSPKPGKFIEGHIVAEPGLVVRSGSSISKAMS